MLQALQKLKDKDTQHLAVDELHRMACVSLARALFRTLNHSMSSPQSATHPFAPTHPLITPRAHSATLIHNPHFESPGLPCDAHKRVPFVQSADADLLQVLVNAICTGSSHDGGVFARKARQCPGIPPPSQLKARGPSLAALGQLA